MSKLTLQQLDGGIEAALANADSLIKEAILLLESNFHARAYTLAHIAREELAKVTMFYATGLRLLAGNSVDWRKLHKRLRDHKSKLINETLMSFMTTPGAADTLSLETMLAGTGVRNNWKNESLYIVLEDQSFRTPSEMISHRKAERTIALANFTLTDAQQLLSVGGKLSERDPEHARQTFGGTLNPDKLEASDALELFKQLSKLFEQARKSETKEGGVGQGPVISKVKNENPFSKSST